MRFRKKPIVIEAVQFDGTPSGAISVFEKFDIPGGKFIPGYDLRTGTLLIPTLEGNHTASHGDWIIRGIKGEFYPCKPDIFVATYEEVDRADTLLPHEAQFLLAERDRLQQELADSRKNHIDANERNMRAEADLAKERERQNELREDWRSQT